MFDFMAIFRLVFCIKWSRIAENFGKSLPSILIVIEVKTNKDEMSNMLNKMILGLKREPKNLAYAIFFGVTSFWAILKPIIYFLDIQISGLWQFCIFLMISLIIALIRIYPKDSVTFKLKNTNTQVSIYFGDIFAEKDNVAVSVNEYFDSTLGKQVSDRSVHGMLIKNVLGGKQEIFDKAVEESLSKIRFENIERQEGKTKKYAIGTTAVLE